MTSSRKSPASDALVTWTNQCAIQLGVCLQRAGVSLASYKGVLCDYSKGAHKAEKHPVRAQEMADWLRNRYLAGFPKAQSITGQDWISKVKSKNRQGLFIAIFSGQLFSFSHEDCGCVAVFISGVLLFAHLRLNYTITAGYLADTF
jgi:hypothetical protein